MQWIATHCEEEHESMRVVDLRSDTITLPIPEICQASGGAKCVQGY
jgi:hypothetical protein